MKGITLFTFSILCLCLMGCLFDKGELVGEVTGDYCDTLNATYTDTMKVLIDLHCADSFGCHGAQSTNGDFTSYANMQAAGVLSLNKINMRVTSSNIGLVMPPGNPLSDSLQRVFKCWANDGFPQQ